MSLPAWQWDEHQQVGTDYANLEEVQAYDERMAALRDVADESARILGMLRLTGQETILEVGVGTGAFACAAAKVCRRVIALDVSAVMLEYARRRAATEGLSNIAFHQAGFLTYEHIEEPVDAVVTQLALHHLPDFWKLFALRRLASVLRPAGCLYLSDVVFEEEAELDPHAYFEYLLQQTPAASRDEIVVHIRQEFSTFDWVMRQLLERSGFVIESAESESGFLCKYLCRKT